MEQASHNNNQQQMTNNEIHTKKKWEYHNHVESEEEWREDIPNMIRQVRDRKWKKKTIFARPKTLIKLLTVCDFTDHHW